MMNDPPPRDGRRLGFSLLLCGVAALWIDLGSLHRSQHADSLISVVISLLHWTPFVWEQDRHGMLIPWLARPFTGPFGNLLVQGFLNVFCGLSVFFLLARYMLRGTMYPLVGAVGAASFLLLAPAEYRFEYLINADHGLFFALGLGGLIVAEDRGTARPSRGRLLVALALIVLTHWVYCGAAVYLGTLVVCRSGFAVTDWGRVLRGLRPASMTVDGFLDVLKRAAGTEPVRALLLLGVGFWVGMQLTAFGTGMPTSFRGLAPGEWPEAWSRFLGRTWRELDSGTWLLALGLAAGIGVVWGLVRDRGDWSAIPWRPAAALLVAAVPLGLFMGTRHWVMINAYAPRYLLPSVLYAQAALAMLAVVPFGRSLAAGGRCRFPALIATLVLLSAAWSYGRPSPRRVRADLDARLGRRTADVLAAKCTHVSGDYWNVWPMVFHANMALRERGETRVIWGITLRAGPTEKQILGVPLAETRIAVPQGDTMAETWLTSYRYPHLTEVEIRPTIRVLRPTAFAPPGPPRGIGLNGPVTPVLPYIRHD